MYRSTSRQQVLTLFTGCLCLQVPLISLWDSCNPGGFDYAQYLAARHVGRHHGVSPREVTVMTGQKKRLVAFLARYSPAGLTVFARHLPAAEAGLLQEWCWDSGI